MVSVATVVREVAEADSALATLLGSSPFRCHLGRLPEGFNNTQTAVVMVPNGGESEWDAPVVVARIGVRCYGGTKQFLDCETVYRAWHDRFHGAQNVDVANGFLISSVEAVGGQPEVDPDTEWPYYVGVFEMEMRGV